MQKISHIQNLMKQLLAKYRFKIFTKNRNFFLNIIGFFRPNASTLCIKEGSNAQLTGALSITVQR